MPLRKTIFANDQIYHTTNRSVAKQPIFRSQIDCQRALEVIDFYKHFHPPTRYSHYYRLPQKEKQNFIENLRKNHQHLVQIIAFCLMPNHLHFLLKQLQDNGVSTFMRNFQNSYARYFNTKYHRSGALFLSMFKAVRIETDEQFLHVSRYIHLNPVTSYLVKIKNLISYSWSSFPEYMKTHPHKLSSPDELLAYFKTPRDYQRFVFDQADYQKELAKIKHLTLESH